MYLGFEVIHVGIGCMDEALRKSRYAVTRYRKLTSYGTVVRYSVPAFRTKLCVELSARSAGVYSNGRLYSVPQRPLMSVGWHAFNYAFILLEWGSSERSMDLRIVLNRTKDLPGLVHQLISFLTSPIAQILFIQTLQLTQGWIKSHHYPFDRSS